jgi:hypothetical protein
MNCDVLKYQEKITEKYEPLKHFHGRYKMNLIAQKHRG